jgi:hypothetical protein
MVEAHRNYRGFSIAANIVEMNVGDTANGGTGLTMITAIFGPHYTWYRPTGAGRKRSLAIFGQGLMERPTASTATFQQPLHR